MYGEGISRYGELVDLGLKYDLVQKSGSWFSMNETRLGQGRDSAKAYFKENPDAADSLEKQIREKMKNAAASKTDKKDISAVKAVKEPLPRANAAKAGISVDADDFEG
jgi:recombination protein RecA